MREHRRHERHPIRVGVEVTIPGLFRNKRRRFHTLDMSDGGVLPESDGELVRPRVQKLRCRLQAIPGRKASAGTGCGRSRDPGKNGRRIPA